MKVEERDRGEGSNLWGVGETRGRGEGCPPLGGGTARGTIESLDQQVFH